jgi:glucose/arabinose dehydrogenase
VENEETPPKRRVRRTLSVLALLILAPTAGYLWWKRRDVPPPPPLPVALNGKLAGIKLLPGLPNLKFSRPVFMTQAPGSSLLYVVEQAGVIREISAIEASKSSVLLDISARVRLGGEEGLLGLAFHPRFAETRRVYVYYSANSRGGPLVGGVSVVSSFVVEAGNPEAPEETVLLEIEQPYRNHNGGMLAFGPDGMLYVGLGDGGLYGDPDKNSLNPGTLLGSILRIDVDTSSGELAYGIPADNPFVGQADARPEVWAYGLRNPWRFSFDRKTGELWAGDVGQNAWEEVDLIQKGGCYGWSAREGFAPYDPEEAEKAKQAIAPLAAYGRGEGMSITGGYVYRGTALPELVGWYVYGDFVTGALWALKRDEEGPSAPDQHPVATGVSVVKILAHGPNIASFGEGPGGELYVCCFDGKIYRLGR